MSPDGARYWQSMRRHRKPVERLGIVGSKAFWRGYSPPANRDIRRLQADFESEAETVEEFDTRLETGRYVERDMRSLRVAAEQVSERIAASLRLSRPLAANDNSCPRQHA
jgi:hypothetical protein